MNSFPETMNQPLRTRRDYGVSEVAMNKSASELVRFAKAIAAGNGPWEKEGLGLFHVAQDGARHFESLVKGADGLTNIMARVDKNLDGDIPMDEEDIADLRKDIAAMEKEAAAAKKVIDELEEKLKSMKSGVVVLAK